MSYQQEKFKEIADKIRERTGTKDPIVPNDFASKIDEVYQKGYDEGFGNGETQGYYFGKSDGYYEGYSALENELLGGEW